MKKEPKKKFVNRMWTFENYENETIKLEGPEQVDKNFVYNFFSCKNCKIIIVGKIKSIQMEGCQKIELSVDTVVSEVSFMNCKVIKAFRIKDQASLTELVRYRDGVHAWLLDSYVPGHHGGTGATFNWDLAVQAKEIGTPIILAGGLTPENIASAIREVRPYAVDVSSGVEAEPGRKDHARLQAFLQAAHG